MIAIILPMVFLKQSDPVMSVGPKSPLSLGFRPGHAFAAALDTEANPGLKIAFALLLADTFICVSRVLEILATRHLSIPYLGVGIHAMTLLAGIFSGGVRRVLLTRSGVLLILFTGWMMICTLFSSWRGGSVGMILNQWLPALASFLICGSIVTLRQSRQIGGAIGVSVAVIAVASFFFARDYERLEFSSGTLGNANDMALVLVLGVPFLLVVAMLRDTSRPKKLLAGAFGLLVLGVSFRTGSRSFLMSLAAMLIVLFWTRPAMGKLKLGLAALALGFILFASVPSYILARYMTIFQDQQSLEDPTEEAYGSSEARKQLLRESLLATLRHPLFGVGPGVFESAQAKEDLKEGKWAYWHETHNAYTQVSSEMGIPGLIFYVGAILAAFGDVLWMRRNSRDNSAGLAHTLALGLLLSITGVCINFFFVSNAYLGWMPMLIGLSVAFRASLQRDLDLQAMAPSSMPQSHLAPPPPSSPAPAPVHAYRFLRPRRMRG